MNEAAFFEQLLNSARKDTAVVASLRRSAAYGPGLYPPVFRYVEPYIHNLSEWRRTATYLAAAYWALAIRMGRDVDKDNTLAEAYSLPKALRVLQARSADTSKTIESRFQALLDADTDELQWRLRHLTSQLSAAGIAIDWPSLLKDLRDWSNPQRRVQVHWARQFWSAPEANSKGDPGVGETTKTQPEAKTRP
jgi:CRISPR system Cascade subunit CasB